ncbi:hypothetical protein SAMD00019534_078180 [Acytostelium subglobosum LB1]|uniref:hypothetical protein n=1 Tax=Acytostelium subglobosum LB1 TaxID=1410327 RepID=UPI000644FC56|nr:hypothetical protein SAMD00019534_078180 [Acytostelium subglobosum LB1]GAM24643.1 hypothetical protein SAMD00019534_078180 [Acytostelium subglobosum LB1]|eukprot:XP_012752312.1 hypothetical protein SAMD00019534_078180 [Acytostelium subglobosum LB1]
MLEVAMFDRPSIDTIKSMSYVIKSNNGQVLYKYDFWQNCFIDNNSTCAYTLPLTRCPLSTAPNTIDTTMIDSAVAKESDVLRGYTDTYATNTLQDAWSQIVNGMTSLLSNTIPILQPYGYALDNLQTLLNAVPASALPTDIQQQIFSQASSTVKSVASLSGNLLTLWSKIKPGSMSNIDTSVKPDISSLLDSFNANQNTQFATLMLLLNNANYTPANTVYLLPLLQSMLEMYNSYSVSTMIFNMIGLEMINLIDFSQNALTTNYQVGLQGLLTKINGDWTSISSNIKQKHSFDVQAMLGLPSAKQDPYFGHYLYSQRISDSMSKINLNQPVQQSLNHPDYGFLRYIDNLKSKTLHDFTWPRGVTGVPSSDGSNIYPTLDPAASFKGSTSLVQIVDSNDSLSLGVARMMDLAPNTTILYAPGAHLFTLFAGKDRQAVSAASTNCSQPCAFPQGCNYDPNGAFDPVCMNCPPNKYLVSGTCGLCQNAPPYSTYRANEYSDNYCPFTCKAGFGRDGISYAGVNCVTCNIGYFSNGIIDGCFPCTFPSRCRTAGNGPDSGCDFLNSAESDSCLVGTMYNLILVDSTTLNPLLSLPTVYLNTQRTIQMWQTLTNLPTKSVFYSLFGVHNSFKVGLMYDAQSETFRPVIMGPDFKGTPLYDSESYQKIVPGVPFHLAIVVTSTMLTFYRDAVPLKVLPYSNSLLPNAWTTNATYLHLGGPVGHRLNITQTEVKIINSALTSVELGWSLTDRNIRYASNPAAKETICGGQAVRCNTDVGFVFSNSTCSCQCPLGSERVGDRCLERCPAGAIRQPDLTCGCANGDTLAFSGDTVTVSVLNVYPDNSAKSGGIKGLTITASNGQPILPTSCVASSFDRNDCTALYDGDNSTYWVSAPNTGGGTVTFTLPPNVSISQITVIPLNTSQTARDVQILIGQQVVDSYTIKEYGQTPYYTTRALATAPRGGSPDQYLRCTPCLTNSTIKDNPTSPDYNYAPTSTNGVCGCNDNNKYLDGQGCYGPLPTPTLSVVGKTAIGTQIYAVSNFANVANTPGYKIIQTNDGTTPNGNSTVLDQTHPFTSNDIANVVYTLIARAPGRLDSVIGQYVIYYQGFISCIITPANRGPYNETATTYVKCTANPQFGNSASLIGYWTIDGSTPTVYSDRYNEQYGIQLVADPYIGINIFQVKILFMMSGYFDFTDSANFTVNAKVRPPTIVPSDTKEVNQVSPRFEEPVQATDANGVPQHFIDYTIYWRLIYSGDFNTTTIPLTKATGTRYDPAVPFIVTCPIPTDSCLVRLQAIGCLGDLCSETVTVGYHLKFNASALKPAITYDYKSGMTTVTIDSRTTITVGLKTMYVMVYTKLRANISCSSDVVDWLSPTQYHSPFPITNQGFYKIYARNYLGSVAGEIDCVLIEQTVQIDPPIILASDLIYADPDGEVRIHIVGNNTYIVHAANIMVSLNSGIANNYTSSSLSSGWLTLQLAPGIQSQSFIVSAIDNTPGYIPSEATTMTITVRRVCSDPEFYPSTVNHLANVTMTGSCQMGCVLYCTFDGSQPGSANSEPCLQGKLLTTRDGEDTSTYVVLAGCFHSVMGDSNIKSQTYVIESKDRPGQGVVSPSLVLNNQNGTVTITCPSNDPQREKIDPFYTVKDRETGAIIPIDNQQAGQYGQQYKYGAPFQIDGHIGEMGVTVVCSVVSSPHQYQVYQSSVSTTYIKVIDKCDGVYNAGQNGTVTETTIITLYTHGGSLDNIHWWVSPTPCNGQSLPSNSTLYSGPFPLSSTGYLCAVQGDL